MPCCFTMAKLMDAIQVHAAASGDCDMDGWRQFQCLVLGSKWQKLLLASSYPLLCMARVTECIQLHLPLVACYTLFGVRIELLSFLNPPTLLLLTKILQLF
jgi:hypothetical protein